MAAGKEGGSSAPRVAAPGAKVKASFMAGKVKARSLYAAHHTTATQAGKFNLAVLHEPVYAEAMCPVDGRHTTNCRLC